MSVRCWRRHWTDWVTESSREEYLQSHASKTLTSLVINMYMYACQLHVHVHVHVFFITLHSFLDYDNSFLKRSKLQNPNYLFLPHTGVVINVYIQNCNFPLFRSIACMATQGVNTIATNKPAYYTPNQWSYSLRWKWDSQQLTGWCGWWMRVYTKVTDAGSTSDCVTMVFIIIVYTSFYTHASDN